MDKSKELAQKPKGTAQKIVEIRNLNVAFKGGNGFVPAVEDFSTRIYQNEIVGIVGESGSGKSVSMLSFLGLLPAHARRTAELIEWQGRDIGNFSQRELRSLCGVEFAYIYQEPSQSYDPLNNVYKTFKEAYAVHGKVFPEPVLEEQICTLLHKVGIDDARPRLRNYLHQFSGGMIQRVQIALSLIHSPKLLIADEVTTALDLSTQKKIVELLQQMCRQNKMSMVFISHDIALVTSIADRILVMKEGKIVENSDVRKILEGPEHEYTRFLLRSTIEFGDRKSRGKN